MVEEMPMGRDGDGGRPSRAAPNGISQRERAALWLNPTEDRRSVRCDRPIRLQAARPGWIRQWGGRKGLAKGRKRQQGADDDGLDLHECCSSASLSRVYWNRSARLVICRSLT